jgi:predicted Mrr-cat superfamily restriction endonuclease
MVFSLAHGKEIRRQGTGTMNALVSALISNNKELNNETRAIVPCSLY